VQAPGGLVQSLRIIAATDIPFWLLWNVESCRTSPRLGQRFFAYAVYFKMGAPLSSIPPDLWLQNFFHQLRSAFCSNRPALTIWFAPCLRLRKLKNHASLSPLRAESKTNLCTAHTFTQLFFHQNSRDDQWSSCNETEVAS
jgi:hypothetical protein